MPPPPTKPMIVDPHQIAGGEEADHHSEDCSQRRRHQGLSNRLPHPRHHQTADFTDLPGANRCDVPGLQPMNSGGRIRYNRHLRVHGKGAGRVGLKCKQSVVGADARSIANGVLKPDFALQIGRETRAGDGK